MTKILLVDDERSFRDNREAVVCRNSDDAIEALEAQDFDEVWLDFVLSIMDDTLEVVKHIRNRHREGKTFNVGEFIVHSHALGAFDLIESQLAPLGYKVRMDWDALSNTLYKEIVRFD